MTVTIPLAPVMVNMDSVKQLFKRLNQDYPTDEANTPISTRKIDSRQLCDHIVWLHAVAIDNGIETIIDARSKEEWDRVMERVK